jgi:putative Mg2+ transporter-C (MgtC) family protein
VLMDPLFESLVTALFTDKNMTIATHFAASLLAGGIIGFERSFHGRPAGFRTHSLVCLASTLLMTLTVYQTVWFTGVPADIVRTDPTRMAQGIMTGIGFLGAGVIFKEGISVRGLTTAASIWTTAGIGILIGVGLYVPAFLATFLTFAILSFYRLVERGMPKNTYVHFEISFFADQEMDEKALRKILEDHGFNVAPMNYHVMPHSRRCQYSSMIRTADGENVGKLVEYLKANIPSHEFRVSPTGD